MALVFNGRFGADDLIFGTDLRDLEIAVQDGCATLYAANGMNGGISSWQLDAGGGLPQLQGRQLHEGAGLRTGSFELAEIGGTLQLLQEDTGAGALTRYRLDADGSPGSQERSVLDGADEGGLGAVAQLELSTGGSAFYGVENTSGRLQGWQLDAEGRVLGGTAAAGDAAAYLLETASDLALLQTAGGPVLLAAGAGGITSYRADAATGALSPAGGLGPTDGLAASDLARLEGFEAYGQSWALAAAPGSSSLVLVQVMADGQLQFADQLNDTLATRFGGASATAVVEAAGQLLVLAAGSDGGLSLFRMLSSGRLVHVESIAHETGLGLQNVTALDAVVLNGQLQVFAASGAEGGISRFSLPLADLGQVREAGAEAAALAGTAGDDVLAPGAAGGWLEGGAGEDVFVIAPAAGEGVTVRDFTPGEDRLDLSLFEGLYSPALLGAQESSSGLVMQAGETRIVLNSAGGGPLSLADVFGPALRFSFPDRMELAGPVPGSRLYGGAGDDTLTGWGGNDTLSGGAGADVLSGGAGADEAAYWSAGAGLVADLQNSASNRGDAAGDSYWSIEHLAGSAHGDVLRGGGGGNRLWGGGGGDTLSGRGGDDTLFGWEGNDRLFGDGGADRLFGENGNDTLSGGAGADVLSGGAGADEAAYWSAGAGLVADLQNAASNRGDAAGDSYWSIEHLAGSAHGDVLRGGGGGNRLWGGGGGDTLSGRGGDDTLFGWEGNDRLFGDGGADRLFGENGNDTLSGGAGADVLSGGAGADEAAYWSAGAGLVADLQNAASNRGDAAGDSYWSIEHLAGSAHGDVLRGGGGGNRLWGGGGGDTLSGRGGDDTLFGWEGNDRLFGDGGADRLFGENGNDTLSGGAGADVLSGGAGADEAAYWSAGAGLVADLQNAASNRGDAAGDSYWSIEHLAGSAHGDVLRGGGGGNRLWGGGGGDTLSGRGGDDTLFGWEGNDRLFGDGGADRLFGENGNDTLSGGAGADVLSGGAGADVFVFEASHGADRISDFTAGEDLIDLRALDLTGGYQAVQQGSGTLISTGTGTILLEGVLPAWLGADDVLL